MKRMVLLVCVVAVLLTALPVAAEPNIKRSDLFARYTPLNAGWNLIGYSGETLPVEDALASIAGQYDTVYGYDAFDEDSPWRIYDVSMPTELRSLWVLEPGRGYWVRMIAPGRLAR